MNKHSAGIFLVVAGLVGCFFHVEYSGWAIFTGIVVLL